MILTPTHVYLTYACGRHIVSFRARSGFCLPHRSLRLGVEELLRIYVGFCALSEERWNLSNNASQAKSDHDHQIYLCQLRNWIGTMHDKQGGKSAHDPGQVVEVHHPTGIDLLGCSLKPR